MNEYLSILINSDGLKILGIVITLDTIFRNFEGNKRKKS